jgi:hypothetical protein
LGTRQYESLRINVNRGGRVLHKHAFPSPIPEVGGCPAIDVLTFVVGGFPFTQNDANQIEWASPIVPFLHLRSDLVIRLGDSGSWGNPLRIVAKGAKGDDVGHGESAF